MYVAEEMINMDTTVRLMCKLRGDIFNNVIQMTFLQRRKVSSPLH